MIIKYGLQPLLIIAVLGAWFFNQTTVLTYPAILLLVQVLLNLLEYWRPLRPHWRHSWREKLELVGVYVAVFGFSAAVVAPLYTVSLDPILVAARAALHINIWPTQWPILMQVLLAFFSKRIYLVLVSSRGAPMALIVAFVRARCASLFQTFRRRECRRQSSAGNVYFVGTLSDC